MTFTTAAPFELARLQRIVELVKGDPAMTMDCMDAAALERRITALERGLPPPSGDRDVKRPIVAETSSRRIWPRGGFGRSSKKGAYDLSDMRSR